MYTYYRKIYLKGLSQNVTDNNKKHQRMLYKFTKSASKNEDISFNKARALLT